MLKGIKEETKSGTKYTSGKITTQNKHDYKYGRFEARLKIPAGQGLWPAFWMMPTNENLYGPWPRCGEIDIMETLGHEPNKAYGTIHYGNPHQEQQGTYTLSGKSFADDYHIFAVEWEPGEMRFYIDGNLYHKVKDWYTKQDGGEEIIYPAPFDQKFYLQFNLAIGGNWPGNPDDTTNFDKEFSKWEVFKDSSVSSSVSSKIDKTNGNNAAQIDIDDTGDADWKIQLKQTGVKLEKGKRYKLSLDAKSTLDRAIKFTIQRDGSNDNDWRPYANTQTVDLGKDYKTYETEFEMAENTDPNSIFTISMGAVNGKQIADKHKVTIDNVKLEEVDENINNSDDNKNNNNGNTSNESNSNKPVNSGDKDISNNPGNEDNTDKNEQEPNKGNVNSSLTSVKTGDRVSVKLLATMLLAFGAGVACFILKKENKNA